MIDQNRLNIFCERLMNDLLTAEERTEVLTELNKLIEVRDKITKALEGALKEDLQRKSFLKLMPPLKGKIQKLYERLQADAQLRACIDVNSSTSRVCVLPIEL